MFILGIPHPASRIPWRLSIPNLAPQFLFAFKSWNLACENIRFSALFAAGSLVPRRFRLGHSWTLPWAVTSPRDIHWERSVARSLPEFARITDRIGSAGTFRAEERNVPSGEERGETDVFVGYLKHGLQIIQIKQIPHPKRPIVDPHIGSFLPFTSYFLNSWLKLEKHHYFLKYHSLCISS